MTAAIALGVVVLTVALFASGRMRYQFFPSIDGDVVFASMTMPQGMPIEKTLAAAAQLEAGAQAGRAAGHAVNLVREVLETGEEGPTLADLDLAGSVENDKGVRALPHRNGPRPGLRPHRSRSVHGDRDAPSRPVIADAPVQLVLG